MYAHAHPLFYNSTKVAELCLLNRPLYECPCLSVVHVSSCVYIYIYICEVDRQILYSEYIRDNFCAYVLTSERSRMRHSLKLTETRKTMKPLSRESVDYLNKNIFPALLSAMREMLREADRRGALEVRDTLLFPR